jgi:putative zinc finger protein
MNWTCAQIEDRLSEYLDRLLEPEERLAFDAHRQKCAQCQDLVRLVSGTLSKVHVLEPVEPPTHLAYAILDKTLGPRTEKVRGWRAWLGWADVLWQPRFAMGVATVAMTAMIVFSAIGPDLRNLTAKDLTPANLYHAADKQVHMIYARSSKFFNDLRVVYEIQSRIQTESRPGQPGDTQQAPAQPNQNQKPEPGRERNRAEELNPHFLIMASAWSGLPGRMNQ